MKKDGHVKQQINIDINPETTPILYTDNVIISSGGMGVILDICQRVGPDRMKIVSRIGMSREHAKKLAQELSKTLAITEDTKVVNN